MNRSAVAGGIGLLAAAVAASLFLSNSTSEPVEALTVASEDRPNVLLLLWDTTRADRMSLYGHDRVTTPYLDKFSSDALVFERAVSPAIWTVSREFVYGSSRIGAWVSCLVDLVGWPSRDNGRVVGPERL
jgi:hypothetical protein